MIPEVNIRAEVTVSGTLRCIDNDGARPLTSEEFQDVISRMADHLDDESGITDPSVWGQASNGDMELYFLLPDPAGPPALNQIADIIRRMSDAVGLIWTNDTNTRSEAAGAPLLALKSQHCDFVPGAA